MGQSRLGGASCRSSYGKNAKALAVLTGLLWPFHNAATGKCFPVIGGDREAAGCARSMLYEAIRALERSASCPG